MTEIRETELKVATVWAQMTAVEGYRPATEKDICAGVEMVRINVPLFFEHEGGAGRTEIQLAEVPCHDQMVWYYETNPSREDVCMVPLSEFLADDPVEDDNLNNIRFYVKV